MEKPRPTGDPSPRPMLLVSFCSPSAIGYAAVNVVRAMLDSCVGSHAVFHVLKMEDVKAQWQDRADDDRTAVLITSDCPHLDVVRLCLSTRGPIVVSSDSFEHVVAYLMRSRGMAFAYAVRLATQVVCALEVLARKPNVLRVSTEDYGRELHDLAAALVAFAGLPCTDERFDAGLRALGAGASGSHETLRDYVERTFPHHSEDVDALDLSAAERAVLASLGRDYGALIEGRPVAEIAWPPEVFCDADRGGEPLSRPLDLLGPARIVLFGPYLHLPVGRWRISVEGEVRDCLSDNRLRAEVVSGRVLAAVAMTLPAQGQRGFDLDFEVTDPFLAVELRVQLLTGAIEGSFRLLDVRLSRRAEAGEAPGSADLHPPGR